AVYVKQFLENRIKDILIYEKAEKNIPQSQELNDLVENYRRSLIIDEYQQQALNEKMRTDVSEADLMDFYKSNSSRFLAERNLVKGIFLKVPKNAPKIENLKKWYKSSSPEEFEKIEKYCVQNGGFFEYFYDRWANFDDILDNIPTKVSNQTDFLKNRSTLEVVGKDFYYLLYINDYILSGNIAPFEYAKPDVKSLMMNTRKTEFLNQIEQDLLYEAKKKRKITYYNVKM
ncbi:MAG: peptidyl-prolyl cis-trans isomerase, partial [Methanobacterium paludis]|nr:peptidyl-prolyl cis-trans isomerase [Methanobacterium paludis]